jgi:hypothetical protein
MDPFYRFSLVLQRICNYLFIFSLLDDVEPGLRSSMATGYGAQGPRSRNSSPGRGKNFYFSMSCKPALRPIQLLIQWVLEALSREVKRPGRETEHSPPTTAEVKRMWVYTSTPPYVSMA